MLRHRSLLHRTCESCKLLLWLLLLLLLLLVGLLLWEGGKLGAGIESHVHAKTANTVQAIIHPCSSQSTHTTQSSHIAHSAHVHTTHPHTVQSTHVHTHTHVHRHVHVHPTHAHPAHAHSAHTHRHTHTHAHTHHRVHICSVKWLLWSTRLERGRGREMKWGVVHGLILVLVWVGLL